MKMPIFILFLLSSLSLSSAQSLTRLWTKAVNKNYANYMEHLAFSPDGKFLLIGNYGGRSVTIWNAKTGEFEYKPIVEDCDIYSVAWSPDNKRIASCGLSDNVSIYNILDEDLEILIKAGSNEIFDIAFSNTGNFIIFNADGYINNSILYNLVDSSRSLLPRATIFDWLNERPDWKFKYSFSPDDKYLSLSVPELWDYSNFIILNVKTLDTVKMFKNLYWYDHGMGFYGDKFIIYDSTKIDFYNNKNFNYEMTFEISNKGCAFSKDLKYALAIDSNNYVSLIDLPNEKIIYKKQVLPDSSVLGMFEISPDNKYFAISGSTGKRGIGLIRTVVECYDLETGEKLWNTKNDMMASRHVAISPDNKYVLTSGYYGQINLFDAKPKIQLWQIINSHQLLEIILLLQSFQVIQFILRKLIIGIIKMTMA